MSLLDTILPSFLNPVAAAVSTVVDRLVPDNNAAQKLKDAIALELAQADIKANLAQLDINKVEAGSSNLWVSGWRPYIGWGFGTGFVLQFAVIPFIGYCYSLFGYVAPPPMHLDPILWEVGFALLGINSGLRTLEKFKGVAS